MTLEELAKELEACDLAMTIHAPGSPWVVWLHAEDDPALGAFIGEGETLTRAVENALASWGGKRGEVCPDDN